MVFVFEGEAERDGLGDVAGGVGYDEGRVEIGDAGDGVGRHGGVVGHGEEDG